MGRPLWRSLGLDGQHDIVNPNDVPSPTIHIGLENEGQAGGGVHLHPIRRQINRFGRPGLISSTIISEDCMVRTIIDHYPEHVIGIEFVIGLPFETQGSATPGSGAHGHGSAGRSMSTLGLNEQPLTVVLTFEADRPIAGGESPAPGPITGATADANILKVMGGQWNGPGRGHRHRHRGHSAGALIITDLVLK